MPAPRSRAFHFVPLITLQVFGLACGLAGVRWSSALIPPEIMGTYSILISTYLFATMVTHQGLIQHAQRHWTARAATTDHVRLLLKTAVRPSFVLGAGLAVVWVALYFIDATITPEWWVWMVAVNLLAAGTQIAHAALQAEERYWAHCITSMVSSATRSFLPLLVVVGGTTTVDRLGFGFLGHTAIWAAVGLFFLRGTWRPEHPPTGDVVAVPPPTMGTFVQVGLYAWVGSLAHRFFAAGALDPTATGHFMLAANLTAIVPTMIGAIGYSYSFPALYAAARGGASHEELWRMTRRSLAGVMVLGQAGLLALAWCGPHLVGVILDPKYGASTEWLLATGGAVLATVSGSFFCNLFIAQDRERTCLALVATSAGFRIAVIGALTAIGNPEWLRLGLSLLPWPTLVLEYGFVRHAQRRDGESRRGTTVA